MATKNRQKAAPAGPVSLACARAACPFFGTDLQYAAVTSMAAGHEIVRWQVRGAGWVSTKLFASLAEAQWHFSHNDGAVPSFPNPYARVGLSERKDDAPEKAQADKMVGAALKFGESVADVVAG